LRCKLRGLWGLGGRVGGQRGRAAVEGRRGCTRLGIGERREGGTA